MLTINSNPLSLRGKQRTNSSHSMVVQSMAEHGDNQKKKSSKN